MLIKSKIIFICEIVVSSPRLFIALKELNLNNRGACPVL